MASQPSIEPHKPKSGSPYFSDPNCSYCKELREIQDVIRLGKPIPNRK